MPHTWQEQVEDLVRTLFNREEFKRFLTLGDGLVARVPEHVPDELSIVLYVHTAISVMERMGLIDDRFFARLSRERPRRTQEIDMVRDSWRLLRDSGGCPEERPAVVTLRFEATGLSPAQKLAIIDQLHDLTWAHPQIKSAGGPQFVAEMPVSAAWQVERLFAKGVVCKLGGLSVRFESSRLDQSTN